MSQTSWAPPPQARMLPYYDGGAEVRLGDHVSATRLRLGGDMTRRGRIIEICEDGDVVIRWSHQSEPTKRPVGSGRSGALLPLQLVARGNAA